MSSQVKNPASSPAKHVNTATSFHFPLPDFEQEQSQLLTTYDIWTDRSTQSHHTNVATEVITPFYCDLYLYSYLISG